MGPKGRGRRRPPARLRAFGRGPRSRAMEKYFAVILKVERRDEDEEHTKLLEVEEEEDGQRDKDMVRVEGDWKLNEIEGVSTASFSFPTITRLLIDFLPFPASRGWSQRLPRLSNLPNLPLLLARQPRDTLDLPPPRSAPLVPLLPQLKSSQQRQHP